MKIGFVLDDTLDKPDGVQQYVLTMGAWLSVHGHTVHYLTGASSRQDVGTVHSLSKNVQVTFNGNRLGIPLPANGKAIGKLLAKEQYDVLHVQMPYSPMLAQKVIRRAAPSTAVVGTFHILPQTRMVMLATQALGVWLRSSLRRFNAVFAVSPAAGDFARKAFRLPNVSVLPNVIALQKFRDAQPFPGYQKDGLPTIMFLGRLVPRKGCAVFLAAIAELKRAHPEQAFQAVVCGKGPLEAELKRQVQQLGISGQVEFTGFISETDKPGYMASADILAFPSSGGESFGYVLIEAMASGRAVVLAGDNPGYRSVLDERPELLFPALDPQKLAGKMYHYLTNTAIRQPIITWQSQHDIQFDVEIVGPQLVDAYHKATALLPLEILRNKHRP